MPEANYLLSVSWGYIKVRFVYLLYTPDYSDYITDNFNKL